MITAKNYAAQAQRGLLKFAKEMWHPQFAKDRGNLLDFYDRIDRSVHFALPDGGKLFDDELRGLKGVGVRLPFPEVTIEYFTEKADRVVRRTGEIQKTPKYLVYAREMAAGELTATFDPIPGVSYSGVTGSGICVLVANEVDGVWVPLPAGCFIPTNWDQTDGMIEVVEGKRSESAPNVVMAPVFLCPTLAQQAIAGSDLNHGLATLMRGLNNEVAALLEFCEAMTCSNVKAETREKVDASKNARRIKDGKLPIFETKILTIEVPGQTSAAIGDGGSPSDRNGPRQHLRRGHIRTLADGRKIWVSSCVVGNPSNGVITKSYNALPGEPQ